jgi:hypothetical protein
VELPNQTAEMIKRYYMNASPFLWGILEGKTKSQRIKEIKNLGYLARYPENTKVRYDDISKSLLIELGIEGILNKIVVPKVVQRIGNNTLNTFRRHWEQGEVPSTKYLKENKLFSRPRGVDWYPFKSDEGKPIQDTDPALIFLEINKSLDFIDRWTVFAGLWFEIIEPWHKRIEK